MKKLILTAFALTAAVSVFAQGTVIFNSFNSLGTTHFWSPSSTAPALSLTGMGTDDSPAGAVNYSTRGMSYIGIPVNGKYGSSTTFAQLLWANGAGAPIDSLQPGGQTTTFRTGTTIGRVATITDTITGLTADGAAATFSMVAWDNTSGNYPTWTQASVAWKAGTIAAGQSSAFTVLSIGGSVNTPPNMLPPAFNLYFIPEPSTFALAGLGAAALLVFRRRK